MVHDMIWDNNEDIRVVECANKTRDIQLLLNDCREERRPYVFITSTMTIKPLRRLLVPVSMLEEETYKAAETYFGNLVNEYETLVEKKLSEAE